MPHSITLKDIARVTGVHVSTVSRALDPQATHSISQDVVKKITDAAREMGYRPNRLAAGLRTRRSMTIGVMIPDITNTLFPPMLRGIESVLEPHGYASIIVNTDGDRAREKRLLSTLLDHGVDGVIDAAPTRNDPSIKELKRANVPVVTLNRKSGAAHVPAVVSDESEGIRAILEYLYEAGHRRIAHIAGPKKLSTGVERLQAFKATAAKLGLEIAADSVVVADNYHEDDGRRAAETLIDSGWGPTAILCANDRLALGTIDVLRARGLDCPGDVSVTGFNDVPLLDFMTPGLTTVRILKRDIGRAAAEILVGMLTDPDRTAPLVTMLPVELSIRGSVAAPRSGLHSATG